MCMCARAHTRVRVRLHVFVRMRVHVRAVRSVRVEIFYAVQRGIWFHAIFHKTRVAARLFGS